MLVFKDQWIFAQGWVEPKAIYLYTAPISRPWVRVESLRLDKKSVDIDEAVELLVNVKNIGKEDGARDIIPTINGEKLSGINVELQLGESKEIRFKFKKSRPGTYVINADDSSTILEVLGPPNY